MLLDESPSDNVDENYDQIYALTTACVERFGVEGCRVYVLVEGNYGDYWQRTMQKFARWPRLANVTVPYMDGNKPGKFNMTNDRKIELCNYVRSAMVEERVIVARNAYFWRAGASDANALHATFLSQCQNFYMYRSHTDGGPYKLELTGKSRGSPDDMVICLALLMELFAFASRNTAKHAARI